MNSTELLGPRCRSVSVVVPTYKRPELLRKCLAALLRQTLRPAEVCVARRECDALSGEVLAQFTSQSGGLVKEVVVPTNGNLVVSMNSALSATTGDFVALTDDDAEAPPEWLERLLCGFSAPDIGGVGGLDRQAHAPGEEPVVGIVRWWGKVIGNHHCGVGPPRDVELLKGVNCCFRGHLLREVRFDERLLGKGNVSHWEMHLCFALRRAGWRLVYDPQIALDHHVGPRLDGDVNARGGFEAASYRDAVHNSVLAMLEHLPTGRRGIYRIWQRLLGTRAEPGVFQALRLLCEGEETSIVLSMHRAVREATKAALATHRARRPGLPLSSPSRTPEAQSLPRQAGKLA